MSEKIMPVAKLPSTTNPRSLGVLYASAMEFLEDPIECRKKYPWADRFVCGMPLAPWQRQVVWDDAMQTRFVDSIWAGVDTGSYMVNAWWKMENESKTMAYLSDIVIDGQQRLTSLEKFFTDQLPATTANGVHVLWSEIPKEEQRYFKNRTFARTEVTSNDENVLREAYDLRSFTGVRHTPDQRASGLKL